MELKTCLRPYVVHAHAVTVQVAVISRVEPQALASRLGEGPGRRRWRGLLDRRRRRQHPPALPPDLQPQSRRPHQHHCVSAGTSVASKAMTALNDKPSARRSNARGLQTCQPLVSLSAGTLWPPLFALAGLHLHLQGRGLHVCVSAALHCKEPLMLCCIKAAAQTTSRIDDGKMEAKKLEHQLCRPRSPVLLLVLRGLMTNCAGHYFKHLCSVERFPARCCALFLS